MLFGWLERRRRRRLLAAPFPADWLAHLRQNVAVYEVLTDAEQARLRDDLRVLIAEKAWEGCGGLAMTDEVKVTVAAHAALLLLGIRHDYFARCETFAHWFFKLVGIFVQCIRIIVKLLRKRAVHEVEAFKLHGAEQNTLPCLRS